MMTVIKDPWNSAQGYESYVGRWSRGVAEKFLDWVAGEQGGRAGRWLDVGSGTGTLVRAIWKRFPQAEVAALDRTHAYLQFMRQRQVEEGHNAARIPDQVVADAQAVPLKGASFDAIVSGLVLNFVPDPAQAVREMRRVARPGGVVALYVWDYAGKMELMSHFWDAAAELDRAAEALDEGRRFSICHPDRLRETFTQTGFRNVETIAIEIDTVFKDFAEYWTPFLSGQGPAPGYAMSLSEERRAELRERIRQRLPFSPDGTIRLKARAWAVRGQNPE